MFDKTIEKKLEFIHKNLIQVSKECIEIREKSETGEVKLDINIKNWCICFNNLDKNILPYINIKNCADYIIFEKTENLSWILHIIECKRTVKNKEWSHIKEQFKGAFLNALAISGYLGINIDMNNIKLYTALRNDKLSEYLKANPIELKSQVGRLSENNDIFEWREGEVILETFNKINCKHEKIQLNVNDGTGSYSIP